jgi:hypothetical protein
MNQHEGEPAEYRLRFTGTWQQNNERSVPPPRNKSYAFKMTVDASDTILRVHITSNNGRGDQKLDLTYEIGGKELVYTGLDGDEYHSRVRWDGSALVFNITEHERTREIPSSEIWTLADSGKSLRRVKVVGSDSAKESKLTYVLERVQ